MTVRVLTGDCRDVLRTLPDGHFHTCVTSPPYFGLRDYGTAKWEGGDAECDHVERAHDVIAKSSTLGPKRDGLKPDNAAFRSLQKQFRSECAKCGARRIDSQIGLEPTPDEFVAALVEVFRDVRRVLRDDGTVWLNLGDSYAAARGGTHQPAETLAGGKKGKTADGGRVNRGRFDGENPTRNAAKIGLKHKDLIGIPWMVAFALRADGWYLRQDIIWNKPNPMPESVRDRCTKAHEYVFLLSKGPRYYFDAAAIAEPAVAPGVRLATPYTQNAVGSTTTTPYGGNAKADRNRRSVWTITTQPFSEAHFATFPPALVEPCIKAGCPVGGHVLDPFGGAGTTALVADRGQRNATIIELNPSYAEMARNRLTKDGGLFMEVAAE